MSIAFRDLPVYDLTGATRNFEQLTPIIMSLEEKITTLEARKNFKLSAPEAQTEREVNKEFEPSATKDALVLLQLNSKAAEVATQVGLKVGGVTIGHITFPKLAEEALQMATIPVQAGKKWEAKVEVGALGHLNSSYAFLD